MSEGHAFLAPSSAHRWVQCPASPSMEALYPETQTTPEAEAGTACHWVFAELFEGRRPAVHAVAPNGVPVDETMLQAADLVYADVVATLGPDWKQRIVVEGRVHAKRVHGTANWGTPDIRGWTQTPNGGWKLHVWDFKYGFNVIEVYKNWQLINYVAGVMDEHGIDGVADQSLAVSMVVIQPRAQHAEGPVRRWTVLASDLRGYINQLANSAAEATGGNAKCHPEPDACEYCRARHACEAVQRAAYIAAEHGHRAQTLDLPPVALGLELRTLQRAAALLDARITGLSEQAESVIRRGGVVPWWAMVPTQGRVKWTVPAQQVIMFGKLAGKDFKKPDEAITPLQAKALAPELATTITAISMAAPGAVKLTPDDGSKAAQIFG